MFGVTDEVQHTGSGELGVTVDEEAGFLYAAGSVRQSGGGAFGQDDFDAFSVLDADGGLCRVGELQIVKDDGGFIFSIHTKEAVVARSVETIGHLRSKRRILEDTDCGVRHGDCEQRSDITSHGDARLGAFVCHIHQTGRIDRFLVHNNAVDVCHVERVTHDRESGGVSRGDNVAGGGSGDERADRSAVNSHGLRCAAEGDAEKEKERV